MGDYLVAFPQIEYISMEIVCWAGGGRNRLAEVNKNLPVGFFSLQIIIYCKKSPFKILI
jgi:hypothetical protein